MTPNQFECEALTGIKIRCEADAVRACEALRTAQLFVFCFVSLKKKATSARCAERQRETRCFRRALSVKRRRCAVVVVVFLRVERPCACERARFRDCGGFYFQNLHARGAPVVVLTTLEYARADRGAVVMMISDDRRRAAGVSTSCRVDTILCLPPPDCLSLFSNFTPRRQTDRRRNT